MQIRAPRSIALGVVAVLAFTAAACGGGASSPPGAAKADSSSPAPTSAPPAASSAKVTKAEATLRSSGGSAATGTATLVQAAEKVEYHVVVSGASEGPHAMYLLQSASCATSGNRTGPLSPLDAAADGQGTADGTMLTQLGSLIGRSLALYAGDKGDSEIVACGQISAAP